MVQALQLSSADCSAVDVAVDLAVFGTQCFGGWLDIPSGSSEASMSE